MKTPRGQALVETAVAVTVFAVLLAAMPGLLVYHDVQRTAHRVARDASFIAAWEGARASRLAEVSRETLAALAWRHPANAKRIIESTNQPVVRLSNVAPPGRAAEMLRFIAAPLRESGGFLGEQFALEQAGFRTATLELEVPPLRGAPEPLASLTLLLRGDASLLTDAWNAAGPEQVEKRAGGLVPSHRLQDAQEPVRALSGVLKVLEPAFEKFCPGLIEPDRLPATRIAALTGSARTVRPSDGGRCR